MIIKDLTNYLETIAPLSYQESYDNCGLLVGDPSWEITNVLVSLDITPEVVAEAVAKGCNVVVAHHPVIFKGLKKINGKNYIEKTVISAIKNDIALYAIHTNLDNVADGVNFKIAETLGLKNIKVLAPKEEQLMKLTVFVPKEYSGQMLDALYAAGAGEIGNYSNCSFRTEGKGTFKPNEKATPWVGTPGRYEQVEENRIEVIFPVFLKAKVLAGMRAGHTYEEISYFLELLQNQNQFVGSGAVGVLEESMATQDFLAHLKDKMKAQVIRHTEFHTSEIKTVAVCGGVGSFLLGAAKQAGADIFVTADYKYHEFFDAEKQIIIADIGHFESEQYTKDLLVEKISKKFTNFATYLSEIDTNPIKYYY
ncbi:Nif3-like dinuclear metal center hexameric protein [Lacihabitans lacunae]|uniref:GTP cyclohydrolase 1 type 2 homolog n=1 Tax=Lacihabitans lacunae TaxID=1028214 RepID=A0ABV7YV88_9BACT